MKSKTTIFQQSRRKLNPELVETINEARKNKKWLEIADKLSQPRKLKIVLNLDEVDSQVKEGDTIVVPGKVLGEGNISKRIKIVALNFSQEAIEKLKDKKCEIVTIKDEISKNKEAKGVKILR